MFTTSFVSQVVAGRPIQTDQYSMGISSPGRGAVIKGLMSKRIERYALGRNSRPRGAGRANLPACLGTSAVLR